MPQSQCTKCTLHETRRQTVWSEIHSPSHDPNPQILAVAEAPGWEEDKWGRPMIGASGSEARHHMDLNGLSARGVLLTNICMCHPPDNRDPLASEIQTCTTNHLVPLIRKHKPKWVLTMGRTATRWFLGDVDMETTHGIPRLATVANHQTIVIPTYHPAVGLHSPETMILFHSDMAMAGGVVRGNLPSTPPIDQWEGNEDYQLITDEDPFPLSPDDPPEVVAVDTEWAKGQPWCLSVSVVSGEAWVIMHDHQAALNRLQAVLDSPYTTTVVHNALYDLPVLWRMGIRPRRPVDTMVMAYLLQNEPQGLKPLSLRHCGMKMGSYSDQVGDATWRLAMDYLKTAMEFDYPDPEPVLEWMKGQPKVRQPQNIKRKIKSILKAVEEKGADPADRWKKVKEGKEVVEEILGPMQEGELCDIPFDQAVYYSARDADATIRIWPILSGRIKDLGLEDTLDRDMKAMPMVVDMMKAGMPVDLQSFAEVGEYFQRRMDEIQREIQQMVGKFFPDQQVNPNSAPQMSKLIYDDLKLQQKGGTHKAKKGGKKSTADDILKRYIPLHPVIQKIIDWRAYSKLYSSYANTIPNMTDEDGRVRTTLRMTRVSTGRLSSSNPNLMAQPTRSDEGKKVRDCYRAEEDKVLLSGDYSQVEMRVAASESMDDKMLSVFWSGEDIHSITASEMFGIPLSQINEMKHRYPAKRVGFGILNLITAEGLHRELVVGGSTIHSIDDCREMIKAWFEIYHGIAKYMKENGEMAKRYGYVRDMWGRIRYIPGIKSVNKWTRLEAERQAGNAPIQSGAQGVIKEAMGQLVPVYRDLEITPLIQIHDDIVWELYDWMTPIAIPKVKGVMENAAGNKMCVPLEVDFKKGKRWGSMEKIKV